MRNQGKQIYSKIGSIFSKKFLAAILLLIVAMGVLSFSYSQEKKATTLLQKQQPIPSTDVLGSSVRVPQIYISSSGEGYSSGGVIELSSTDEPAVVIGGYNVSGTAEVAVYQANDDVLLDYLTHDKDGKQKKQTPDLSKIHYVTTVKKDINTGNSSRGDKISLPLSEVGIWYLDIKLGSTKTNAFIIRSNIGAIAKEGDNEFIFWGQDFRTKRSVTEGVVIPFNLLDTRKELERSPFDSNGIAKAKLRQDADIALIAHNDDRAVIPINLKYLNTSYTYSVFQEKVRRTRYFIFTDRPLYKPGDTVYFKAILRDDDDARYTVPEGDAAVKIYNGYYYEGYNSNPQPIFEKTYSVSSDGTINGQYQIPADGKVGSYSLVINIPNRVTRTSYWNGEYSSNSISFDVEFFKKPEFSIEVTTPKTELIAGDKTSFKINGTYFSGQPLLNQKVKYTVY
ncbi:MG2 domain-containing protein, partial [Patescibacteria group bacterium]|nr:MG2 domain-containing protein [Patescibacteria group bacterium]